MIAFEEDLLCSKIQKPSQIMTRSALKLLLLEEDAIKTSRTKRSRHQDKTRRKCLLCFACLLGWILLGRMDGSYAWIGSENSVQDSQENTPRCEKSPIHSLQYNTFIFVLHQSIFMRKRTLSHFPIQKSFFNKKFFSFLVFIFKFNFLKHPINFTGR